MRSTRVFCRLPGFRRRLGWRCRSLRAFCRFSPGFLRRRAFFLCSGRLFAVCSRWRTSLLIMHDRAGQRPAAPAQNSQADCKCEKNDGEPDCEAAHLAADTRAESGVEARATERAGKPAALGLLHEYYYDKNKARDEVDGCQHPDDEVHVLPLYRVSRDCAAPTMAAKESASRLAPPTRAPSISLCASSSAALSGLTLPPYWILSAEAVCSS